MLTIVRYDTTYRPVPFRLVLNSARIMHFAVTAHIARFASIVEQRLVLIKCA